MRQYVPKKQITDPEKKKSEYLRALKKVLFGWSCRKAAKHHGLPRACVTRFAKRIKNGEEINLNVHCDKNRIFTDVQEKSLALFIQKSADLYYGMSIDQCKKLFYDMAKVNNISVPTSWHKNLTAGEDFYYGFMKRHPSLSLRTPEGCSLARVRGFNKVAVTKFYSLLKKAMERHPKFMDGSRVFNLDEHGETTVPKPKKVVARRGARQVSQVTSAEKGPLVTICAISNATGTYLPPVILFPRKNFKTHMLHGAPSGTLGLANSSGWMDGPTFLKVLQHFKKEAHVSKDNPALLILDNHESHLTYEVLRYAKKHNITMLTIPPHSSHKLQPLDVANFGPFSTKYDKELLNWIKLNPNVPATIYEVAALMGKAHDEAMTPSNIKAGFRATGIYPLNSDIFTESDFAASLVSDQPLDEGSMVAENQKNVAVQVHHGCSCDCSHSLVTQPTSSSHLSEAKHSSKKRTIDELQQTGTTVTSKSAKKVRVGYEAYGTPDVPNGAGSHAFVGPETFLGFPKAAPRKVTRRGRRKGKSMIATDSPEIKEVEDRRKAREQKELDIPTFSDADEGECIDGDETAIKSNPAEFDSSNNLISEGDFVVIEVDVKKKISHLIGKIIKANDDDSGIIGVSCLRRSEKVRDAFTLPPVPDLREVKIRSVKTLLPKAVPCGLTKRQQSLYKFCVNLENYLIY